MLPAGLSPKKMVLWEVVSEGAPAVLWLFSFFMEMDTNQSEAAHMEANAYQGDHVIKSKVEGEKQLKQQGLDNTQNLKGDFHNGEYWCCLDGIQLGLVYIGIYL